MITGTHYAIINVKSSTKCAPQQSNKAFSKLHFQKNFVNHTFEGINGVCQAKEKDFSFSEEVNERLKERQCGKQCANGKYKLWYTVII